MVVACATILRRVIAHEATRAGFLTAQRAAAAGRVGTVLPKRPGSTDSPAWRQDWAAAEEAAGPVMAVVAVVAAAAAAWEGTTNGR